MKNLVARSLLLVGLGLAPSVALADPKAELKAGTGIENRELTGAGDSFKKTDTVYVWSNITDADGKKVAHVWKLDGKEVFKASFDVKSKRWRLNSKRRTPKPGAYVVEAQTEDGTKIGEVAFKVE